MPFDNPHQAPIGDLERLTDARSRISSQSMWVQGSFRDGHRHCLVAALSLASGSRDINMPNRTERRLARLLARHLPPKRLFWIRIRLVPARHRLMAFNDNTRTSHEDVMALFDRTIHHLASKILVRTSA